MFSDVNGKTLHVVQKPPPNAPGPSTANIDSERHQPSATRHSHGPSTVVLGSYTVPADNVDPNQVQVGIAYSSFSNLCTVADFACIF